MKTLITAITVAAFAAAPAIACEFGKTASYEKPMVNASKSVKTESAMTTFDPDEKPEFKEQAIVKRSGVENSGKQQVKPE